ncbi:hypothetical protein BSKO_05800 [Bryopsis sp. KO-2023]|nr:hypothetical protein BSKO_05800 [Bryopsis sp. KO-2023]
MAKTDVRGRYGAIYKKAFDLVEKWDVLQEAAKSKLGSVASGLGGLQIFEVESNFSRLEGIPDAQSLLTKRQISAIEEKLKELRELLGQFGRIAKMHANNAGAGENIVRDLRIPRGSLKTRTSAADPSISETIEGLQEICKMYEQEFETKKSIIGFLTYESSESDVLDLQRVFNAEVHINRHRLRDLQVLMVVQKPTS